MLFQEFRVKLIIFNNITTDVKLSHLFLKYWYLFYINSSTHIFFTTCNNFINFYQLQKWAYETINYKFDLVLKWWRNHVMNHDCYVNSSALFSFIALVKHVKSQLCVEFWTYDYVFKRNLLSLWKNKVFKILLLRVISSWNKKRKNMHIIAIVMNLIVDNRACKRVFCH